MPVVKRRWERARQRVAKPARALKNVACSLLALAFRPVFRALSETYRLARAHPKSTLTVLVALTLFAIGLFTSLECLSIPRTDNASLRVEQLTLTLTERVVVDPRVTRRIASLEIKDAEEVSFCGRPGRTLSPVIDVIGTNPSDTSVDAGGGEASPTDGPPAISELQVGSTTMWTLLVEAKKEDPTKIHLTVSSSDQEPVVFYARPKARLGTEPCERDLPIKARGRDVRLTIHLREGTDKEPSATLFREKRPHGIAGVLSRGEAMTAILTRFKSCSWHTGSEECRRFGVRSVAEPDPSKAGAGPEPGSLVLESVALAAEGLVSHFEWGMGVEWDNTGECRLRCMGEFEKPVGSLKP